MEEYTFAKSSSIDFPVFVKIDRLEGRYNPPPYSQLIQHPEQRFVGANTGPYSSANHCVSRRGRPSAFAVFSAYLAQTLLWPPNERPNSDLLVTVQVWANSQPITEAAQTPYKSLRLGRRWDQWLELPIPINQLPNGSQLAITIWDWSASAPASKYGHVVPFGGTTISLFDADNTLRKGQQQCRVHRGLEADGFVATKTPACEDPRRGRGAMHEDDVLLTLPERTELERLEGLLKQHEAGEIAKVGWLDHMVLDAIDRKRKEVKALTSAKARAKRRATQAGERLHNEDLTDPFILFIDLPRFDYPIVFADYEYEPTPVSALAASPPTTVNLKPPPEVQLGPGIHATGDQNDDHQYPLIQIYDPEVGAKDNPVETKHRRLVRSQRTGLLDKDLKPNAKIRDELHRILALGPTHDLTIGEKDIIWKYRHHLTREKRALTKFVKSVSWVDEIEARQAIQLLPKWTMVDIDDALELLGPTIDNSRVRAYAVDRLRLAEDEELLLYLLQLVQALKFDRGESSSLASFLITRATQNLMLGTFLHWYLMVECDDHGIAEENVKLYARIEYDFMSMLTQTEEGQQTRKTLLRQGELIAILSRISKEVRFSREDRPRRIAKLKSFLNDSKNELRSFDPPLPLPLDPSILLTGIVPEESNVFKSSLFPLLLTFRTTSGAKYSIIFKTGDDLRQDQLVIQIISLMDQLLKKENLDLRLTAYRILATSATAGAVQFVASTSLAAALAKYKGSILAYLRSNNPDSQADLGVRKETMDTYVKSCAGYCVITYLLGVGDRHLDNLLLAPDGHFFHADFGYILGRDPKPFAPQMKLCREMVEGMGGSASSQYQDFKSYCFTAYIALRKSSSLILNLFALMVDANITDICLMNREGRNGRNDSLVAGIGTSAAVEKVRERFHLEMSEEEAIRHFEALIADSVGAIFPVVIDTIHNMMQGLRT